MSDQDLTPCSIYGEAGDPSAHDLCPTCGRARGWHVTGLLCGEVEPFKLEGVPDGE